MNKYLSVGSTIKPKLCAVLGFVFEAVELTKLNKRKTKGIKPIA